MDNEVVTNDNILFIVEGKKAEANYIKAIYEQYYPHQFVVINRVDNELVLEDISGKNIIDINWIENANIQQFVSNIEEDEYSYGVSIINSFVEKNDVKTYSEAFIIIDADLKDKSSGGDNAANKIKLINKLLKIVEDNDENVEVIINSPMLEGIVDEMDGYTYKSGESYKSKINSQFANGAFGQFQNNISEVLKMNVLKYGDIDYQKHSTFALDTFDNTIGHIKVRSPLFHIIANKEIIYGETERLISFLDVDNR